MSGTGRNSESRVVDFGDDALNAERQRMHLSCGDGTDVCGMIDSELAAASVGTNRYGYAYDTIGNRLRASANATTNSCSANCLNQYASILRASASPCMPTYDADGNLTQDGNHTYAYDAENRLVSVMPIAPINGDLSVFNAYDHAHRRILKRVKCYRSGEWVLSRVHSFVYDGSNIVLERITHANGDIHTVENFWGNDLSGTEEGAGGVGGLLAVSIDGSYFFPCYDGNGNVVRYIGEDGSVAARFVCDPYGNVLEQEGAAADSLRIRFGTKYADPEVGVVSYLMRFYDSSNGRWLNRDPIGEEGGVNLYAFCSNNPIHNFDKDGRAYFIKRSMFGVMYRTARRDVENQEWAHEQLVFEDGKEPRDVGFFGDGKVREDPGWQTRWIWRRVPGRYNDCVMRKAVESVRPKNYQMRGDGHYNCQDYADDLRARYGVLIRDKKVRCECGLSK